MKTPRIIPMPQHIAWGEARIEFSVQKGPVLIHLDANADDKERLAAEWLKTECEESCGRANLFQVVSSSAAAPGIHLTSQHPAWLDQADIRALNYAKARDQGYVLHTIPEKSQVWLVGSGARGVLYAVATLLQLMALDDDCLRLPTCQVRDWPDVPWRMAADWLLEAELRMWAYDWGDGRRAYVGRIKRQLDFCLRHKINAVAFDGYGWVAERFPGYSAMMRELNAYARARHQALLYRLRGGLPGGAHATAPERGARSLQPQELPGR